MYKLNKYNIRKLPTAHTFALVHVKDEVVWLLATADNPNSPYIQNVRRKTYFLTGETKILPLEELKIMMENKE